MTFRATGPVKWAVDHVARNMRAADHDEIFATRWSEDVGALVRDTLSPGLTWVGWDDREPVAVYGAKPMWPGNWSVFMYATDHFGHISSGLTRHIRRVMMQGLMLSNAHRAQCYSMGAHTQAHDWLRFLGAEEHSRLPLFGKNGEEFALFVWTKESVSRVLRGR